jgi:hypothetical protein
MLSKLLSYQDGLFWFISRIINPEGSVRSKIKIHEEKDLGNSQQIRGKERNNLYPKGKENLKILT